MNFILGTAGHIDHGKSSLVKALTGIATDRLPEEQKRGVTIELGFTHLELNEHQIGIVDVPGHADFVNNMVSGVGALDIALFVVAADDSWMPQSEEHLHILSYLGIKNIIIALTKVDVCEDVEFVVEMLRDELQGTAISEAPIIPVSSHTGEGIEELKNQIAEMATTIKHDNKGKISTLHIDRVFSPKGVGTVVTGTLCGCEISPGDTLMCYPILLPTSIRHIQMHQSSSQTAPPGSRVGLNLADLSIEQRGKPGARRGYMLANPGLEISKTLDVQLERLSREVPGQSATRRALKNTESVILHLGTARIKARVILNDRTTLAPGETCFAQLRLEESVAACIGDRFVLRDGAQQGTLAGGIILNPVAESRRFRTPERAEILLKKVDVIQNSRALLLHELDTRGFVQHDHPILNSPFRQSTIDQVAQKLISEKKAYRKGDFITSKKWWQESVKAAGDIIQNYHQQNPHESVMPLDAWRSALQKQGYKDLVHGLLEDALTGSGYQKKELGISHNDHNLELPPHLEAIADKIIAELESAGLQPPILVEFIDTPEKEQCLKFLIKSKQVAELSPKAILLQKTLDQAMAKVVKFIETNGPATSSDIRQSIGATRKVLIPLLELMDAKNITRRDGDHRNLL